MLIEGGSNGLPDLTVTNLVLAAESGSSGDGVNFNFNLNYSGAEPAGTFIWIRAYLSEDDQIDSNDFFTSSRIRQENIPPGTTNIMGSFGIPFSIPNGNYYLILDADATDHIDESNENNNTVAAPFEVIEISTTCLLYTSPSPRDS